MSVAERRKIARAAERQLGQPFGEPTDATEARAITDEIKTCLATAVGACQPRLPCERLHSVGNGDRVVCEPLVVYVHSHYLEGDSDTVHPFLDPS